MRKASIWNQWSMTVNHEAPISSAALAVSAMAGASAAEPPGMVKSMK